MFAEGTIFFSNSDSQPFHSKSLENYLIKEKQLKLTKKIVIEIMNTFLIKTEDNYL